MSLRSFALYFLSLPLLIFGLVFDVIKLPFILLFFLPLWGFLDLLAVLRGEESMIVEMVWETSTIGIRLWCAAVGLNEDW